MEWGTNNNFWWSFLVFWGQTLITLSKMIQFSKIKAYFMQNFIEFYMKYVSYFPKLDFGVWNLRTSFEAKRLANPKVQNSVFNICKQVWLLKCYKIEIFIMFYIHVIWSFIFVIYFTFVIGFIRYSYVCYSYFNFVLYFYFHIITF